MKRLLIVILTLLTVSMVRADEGMWLLSLLKQQNIEKMQQMGFKLSAEDIEKIDALNKNEMHGDPDHVDF